MSCAIEKNRLCFFNNKNKFNFVFVFSDCNWKAKTCQTTTSDFVIWQLFVKISFLKKTCNRLSWYSKIFTIKILRRTWTQKTISDIS